MTERSITDKHGEYAQAVEAAVREERAAREALNRGLTPSHRNWTPSEEGRYAARLERWHVASHALVEALNRLATHR